MRNFSKLCTKCKVIKSYSRFHSNKTRKDGLKSHCKDCENLASRSRNRIYADERKLNPDLDRMYKERTRKEKLKHHFGLTVEDYDKMLESQGGRCAICFSSESERNKRLVVDHCHSSNQIRGLLCSSCNTGIGLLKENIKALQSAIDYLQSSIS